MSGQSGQKWMCGAGGNVKQDGQERTNREGDIGTEGVSHGNVWRKSTAGPGKSWVCLDNLRDSKGECMVNVSKGQSRKCGQEL